MTDPRLRQADVLYEAAVFGGDTDAVGRAEPLLNAVEADLALARARLLHASYLADRNEDPAQLPLLERAAELYKQLGDERGEAEALFWLGTYHQVLHQDGERSLPYLLRAEELASSAGDRLLLSYIVRHLGFVEQYVNHDPAAARARLQHSVDLRREVGHLPGVAAGLLSLAEVAPSPADRARLLDEAEAIASGCGANGVLGWIAAVRHAG